MLKPFLASCSFNSHTCTHAHFFFSEFVSFRLFPSSLSQLPHGTEVPKGSHKTHLWKSVFWLESQSSLYYRPLVLPWLFSLMKIKTKQSQQTANKKPWHIQESKCRKQQICELGWLVNGRTGKLWWTYTALRQRDSNLLNTSESRTFCSCHLGVITMLRGLVQPLLPFFRPWLRAQINWLPCSWTKDTHNRHPICCISIKKLSLRYSPVYGQHQSSQAFFWPTDNSGGDRTSQKGSWMSFHGKKWRMLLFSTWRLNGKLWLREWEWKYILWRRKRQPIPVLCHQSSKCLLEKSLIFFVSSGVIAMKQHRMGFFHWAFIH